MSRSARLAERALSGLESQQWLDRPGYRIEHAVGLAANLLGDLRQPVGNLLHGTWLGHPLHAALTDVPVGAWTTALVLDVAGTARPAQVGYHSAARRSVGVGLVGGAVSALAGLADWQYTEGNARRVGLVHGSLNLAAMSCYTASWLYRGRGGSRPGRRASTIGYALVLASGYLGGSMVSRHRVGVDHGDRRLEPRQFTAVLSEDELHEEEPVQVRAAGMSVLLVRRGGTIHAMGEQCAHLGGPLSKGWLRGDTIVCPWHGSAYELASGAVRRGPATCALPTFETRVVGGQIEVRCRPPAPGASPGSVVAREQGRADARH